MSLCSSAAFRQLRVPGGAEKNNHRGKLHPDDQADHGGQPAVNNAVRHAANVNSEEHVHQPPQECSNHRAGQYFAHAVFLRPRYAINHRQRQHGKHHRGGREKEIPPSLQNGVLADFMGDPSPQRLTQNAENGRPQQRSNGYEQQHQTANLPVQKPEFVRILIDGMNPLHHQLHDLGPGEQGSRPSQRGDLPCVRSALYQELRDDPLAPRRQELCKIGDQIKETRLSADPAGSQRHGNQQCWKKREEKIEGNGLGDHSASRKYAREHHVHPPKNPRCWNHSPALYLPEPFFRTSRQRTLSGCIPTRPCCWRRLQTLSLQRWSSHFTPVFPCGSLKVFYRLPGEWKCVSPRHTPLHQRASPQSTLPPSRSG